MNIADDQEGVMDSLLEALQNGSAFSRDQRRKRDRPPRAVGGAERANRVVNGGTPRADEPKSIQRDSHRIAFCPGTERDVG